MHQKRNRSIFILLLPVEHEWLEFVSWELIFDFLFERFILLTEFIKDFDFFLDDPLAFLKHFNLCIELVHLVLIFEDHVLIDISDLELEVFGTHG